MNKYISWLLLYNKLPENLVIQNNKHLLLPTSPQVSRAVQLTDLGQGWLILFGPLMLGGQLAGCLGGAWSRKLIHMSDGCLAVDGGQGYVSLLSIRAGLFTGSPWHPERKSSTLLRSRFRMSTLSSTPYLLVKVSQKASPDLRGGEINLIYLLKEMQSHIVRAWPLGQMKGWGQVCSLNCPNPSTILRMTTDVVTFHCHILFSRQRHKEHCKAQK